MVPCYSLRTVVPSLLFFNYCVCQFAVLNSLYNLGCLCQIHCLGDRGLRFKYLLQFCSTYVPVIACVLKGVLGVGYVFSSIVGFRVLCVEKPRLQ
jgi:hypothetical protein